jgi:hypothetical protein
LFWGSQPREVLRLILPTVAFFVVRLAAIEKWQIKRLLLLMIIGYIFPIVGSALLISLGKSIYMTIYWTGLERYAGMYAKIHSFAHAMFIFLFIFLMYLSLDEENESKKSTFIYFCYFLSVLAIFNLYFSYTRTVYLGLLILVFWHLLGRRSHKTIVVCTIVTLVIILFDVYASLQGDADLSSLGSGRIGGWTSLLNIYSNSPFYIKALGFGSGGWIGQSRFSLAFGHNDLLSLLLTLGAYGLLLYLFIVLKFFYDITKFYVNRVLKYTLLGFLFAVFAMNFLSNSYLARFELGQYFFFVVGIFYALNEIAYSNLPKIRDNAHPHEWSEPSRLHNK